MNAQTVAGEIAAYLLDDSPDVPGLSEKVSAALAITSVESGRMIRRIASQINGSMFPPLSHLELILTEGCNLACTYCFEKEMLGYRRMPLDVAQAAVDILFEYSRDVEVLQITHFGGEPTLNFPAIRAVTEYAEALATERSKNLEFNTTTNGTRLNEEMVEYFHEHRIMVLVSVDGLAETNDKFRLDKRGHGTFERAMSGLRLLKARQKWVGVKITVMPENALRLLDDVRGLYDLGVNQFLIGHATGVDWPAECFEEYSSQLRSLHRWYQDHKGPQLKIAEFDEEDEGKTFFGCQAGRNSIAVSVDGEISPCSKILALDNKKLLAKLGDVRFGMTHIRNRAELVSCSRLTAACENKNIAADYRGGCFASNFSKSGDLFDPNIQDHRFSVLNRSLCAGCGSSAEH